MIMNKEYRPEAEMESLDDSKKVEILSKFIRHLIASQAAMVVPLIKKYGDEAKEYVKNELRKIMRERFKRMCKEKGLGDDLNSYRKMIWDTILLPSSVLGQMGGTVVEASDKKLWTRDTKCIMFEGWKETTDSPEIMCEIDAEIEKALAEAVNPNLHYTKYYWGMPRGEPHCEFIVEFKKKPTEKK